MLEIPVGANLLKAIRNQRILNIAETHGRSCELSYNMIVSWCSSLLINDVFIYFMIRKALNCLLITLIALQSVVAFADLHQFHQPSSDEHVSYDDHSHQKEKQSSRSDDVIDPQSDCHHCCHCHGGANPFLSKAQRDLNASCKTILCSNYLFSNNSYLDSPENPPPIK